MLQANKHRITLPLSASMILGAVFVLGSAIAQNTKSLQPTADIYEKQIFPLIDKHCILCHGAKNPKAGLNLTDFNSIGAIQKNETIWRKVVTQVRERAMPPIGILQPTQEQRDMLTTWVTLVLNSQPAYQKPNPGRKIIHRLNRIEYNNTVRDLFGITSNPADRFPADGGGGGGFDNNADTLFVPPILMERYLQSANDILDEAKPERIFRVKPSAKLPKRDAAKQILAYFAYHGFRRPVQPNELTGLLRLYDIAAKDGEPFEKSVKFALKGVLVSPNFLFRVEKEQNTASPYPISDYELATRLSYFLWASTPDDELLKLANVKRLHDPKILDTQVDRLLKSPKATALAESFAAQWLKVKDLYTSSQPDPGKYPIFTPTLRDAMYQETIRFFDSALREEGSLLRLLDCDYTFVNEELAKHYGMEGVTGKEMRRVKLNDKKRGGVLTMASILTLTSYPLRTSPVLRGKYIMEQMLGIEVPPPPPVLATLPPDDQPREGLTFRQRLEKHRQNTLCAGCHSRMDPLGFGLENFDAVGKWRDEIGGKPVDASGVLPPKITFNGSAELKQIVLQRKDDFIRNLTGKMLSYSLGRGLEPYDTKVVEQISMRVLKADCRNSLLIHEIVKSYPFQYRQNSAGVRAARATEEPPIRRNIAQNRAMKPQKGHFQIENGYN